MVLCQLVFCLLLASACASATWRTPPHLQATPSQRAHGHQDWRQLSAVTQHELERANTSSRGSSITSSELEVATDMLKLSRPFIVRSGNVRGPVGAQLQAELLAEESAHQHGASAAGALRGLLHGVHKPNKYPKCSSCRMVTCNKRRLYCSGHCRQKKKFFFCDSNSVASASCVRTSADAEPRVEDFEGLPPDSIAEYDTVVVTVEAPYIGCADIANRPSACPADHTRATLQDGREVTVAFSRCRSEPYAPDCGTLLPFGACECFYRADGRLRTPIHHSELIWAPCRTTELARGSGVAGSTGIVVHPGGEFTQTWFSDFVEPGQEPSYAYNVTATLGSAAVDVSMSVYQAMVMSSDALQAGSPIAEEYVDDYEADIDGILQDYVPYLIERGLGYDHDNEDP